MGRDLTNESRGSSCYRENLFVGWNGEPIVMEAIPARSYFKSSDLNLAGEEIEERHSVKRTNLFAGLFHRVLE